ncbi:MAG: sigma-54-dependent Fis family transcriptional regulator [Geminicoccaceae bacterium]|nr:sigma-54-dependent Fis family transcriptional regulator [Geminicoccaceae bacterium]
MVDAPRILVADDQRDVLEALRLLLKGEGYETETVGSPGAVLASVQKTDFDAVLLDLNYARDTTTGREGLELVSQLRAHDASLPTIVMTAWGSIDKAVEAMRRGARDFIEKPWENARLLATLRSQVELGRALRRSQRLEGENQLLRPEGAPALIAESPAMRPVLQLLRQVAPSDANILITGEHGTGKEVVASWIHAASPRAARSLVAVNLGGLAEGLFESEMFGHVKGAFTDARTDRIGRFELAEGGTLLLDEVGTLPLRQQAKLLRVLESGALERVGSSRTRKVDARVLSATNADLRAEVAAGRFREDLLFRLNTIEIHLPPLRERREDIGALAQHFLTRYSARYRKPVIGFEPEALSALEAHRWPGNVRELDHTVERAVLLATGARVTPAELGLKQASPGGALDDMPLDEVERVLIRKALDRHGGNVSHAAKALGLSRSALYRRLQQHGF